MYEIIFWNVLRVKKEKKFLSLRPGIEPQTLDSTTSFDGHLESSLDWLATNWPEDREWICYCHLGERIVDIFPSFSRDLRTYSRMGCYLIRVALIYGDPRIKEIHAALKKRNWKAEIQNKASNGMEGYWICLKQL